MKPRILFLAILLSLLCVPAIANTLSSIGDASDASSSSHSSSSYSSYRVPEPGSMVLLLSAIAGVSGYYVVRKKK